MQISALETGVRPTAFHKNLLHPSLQNRNPRERFSPEEKALLKANLQDVWSTQESIPATLLIDFRQFPAGVYPDGEPYILNNLPPEIIEQVGATGQLAALARLETPADVLGFRALLDDLGNPATFLGTMFLPLERGDRPGQRPNGQEVVILRRLLKDLAGSGVQRIITTDTHSPAFPYFALESGMRVLDITPLPLMFKETHERGLFEGASIIPVTGDYGATERALMAQDLALRLNIPCQEPIFGEKQKSVEGTRVFFNPEDLKKVAGLTAVVFEDILATGETIGETVKQLLSAHARAVVVLVTHPIVAGNAPANLANISELTVITTDSRSPLNTIASARNFIQIPVSDRFAQVLTSVQQDLDPWSLEGKSHLEELGFSLAPWLFNNYTSGTSA